MYQFNNILLPPTFINFFQSVSARHTDSYNTRLASKATYSLSCAGTIYGKFKLRFLCAQIWNDIDESIKLLHHRRIIDLYYE